VRSALRRYSGLPGGGATDAGLAALDTNRWDTARWTVEIAIRLEDARGPYHDGS
jgi:hypothetical protein